MRCSISLPGLRFYDIDNSHGVTTDNAAYPQPLTQCLGYRKCYGMGRAVCIDYGTEKREGERLEIYTGGISPSSSDCVSDL
jgi:hypothetical protein